MALMYNSHRALYIALYFLEKNVMRKQYTNNAFLQSYLIFWLFHFPVVYRLAPWALFFKTACQVISPFHKVIPVNCLKIPETTLPVDAKMGCSHRQWCSVFLLVKHHSHIILKIPVNSVTTLTRNYLSSWYCVCKPGRVHSQWFYCCFNFCQTITFMQLLLAQRHCIRWIQTELHSAE